MCMAKRSRNASFPSVRKRGRHLRGQIATLCHFTPCGAPTSLPTPLLVLAGTAAKGSDSHLAPKKLDATKLWYLAKGTWPTLSESAMFHQGQSLDFNSRSASHSSQGPSASWHRGPW